MTQLAPNTSAVAPGKSFSLSNTVKNQGGSSAGSFAIAFHLSLDPVYGGTDDIAFTTTRSVSSLGVGASSTGSTTLTVPSTTPLGSYYVCALADSGGAVIEGNEANNALCSASTIQVTRPDLLMVSVTPSSGSVNAGATLSVNDTVQNQGLISVGAFSIAYHLSLNTVYGDSDDVVISTTRSVSALAAGATNSGTVNLTIPSATKGGVYRVCAKADSGGTVAETNESNNTLCSVSQVTVPPPDLIMSALSTVTTAVAPGKTFSLSNTAMNQGGSLAGAFVIDFHLSSGPVYGGADDIAFSPTRMVSSLGVGASNTGSTTLTVPATTPLGNYYICAKADTGGTVSEGNEANNTLCTASAIQVTLPDLLMVSVTPNAASVNAGATLSVSDTVKNQGAVSSVSSRVAYRLSLNTIYGDGDDVVIATTRLVSALAAGAINSGTVSLTIPSATKGGIYRVCAKADSGGTVAETNESNNTLCSTTSVTVVLPDLIMTGLSTSATSARAGGTFSLSSTVKNQGGSNAGAFAIGFVLSPNTIIGDADDIALTPQRSLTGLGLGLTSTSTGTTTVTVPAGTPAANYHIGAIADMNGTVSEGNEGNNTIITTSTIRVQ